MWVFNESLQGIVVVARGDNCLCRVQQRTVVPLAVQLTVPFVAFRVICGTTEFELLCDAIIRRFNQDLTTCWVCCSILSALLHR